MKIKGFIFWNGIKIKLNGLKRCGRRIVQKLISNVLFAICRDNGHEKVAVLLSLDVEDKGRVYEDEVPEVEARGSVPEHCGDHCLATHPER